MARQRAAAGKPAALKRGEAAARGQRALLARYLEQAGAAQERALAGQVVHAWGVLATEGGRRAVQRRLNVVSYRIAELLARGSTLRRLFNFWVSATGTDGAPQEQGGLARAWPRVLPPPGLSAPPGSSREAWRASFPFQ